MNVSVCDWLVVLHVVFSRFIHFVSYVSPSVLSGANNRPVWCHAAIFPALWRLKQEGILSLKLTWAVALDCYHQYLEIYFIYIYIY